MLCRYSFLESCIISFEQTQFAKKMQSFWTIMACFLGLRFAAVFQSQIHSSGNWMIKLYTASRRTWSFHAMLNTNATSGILTLLPNYFAKMGTNLHVLTHLALDKMSVFSQMWFWDAFSWMKCFVIWFKFHWCLVQLTITKHWFR